MSAKKSLKKTNSVSAESIIIKHIESLEKTVEKQDLKSDQIIEENIATHKQLVEINATLKIIDQTLVKQEENLAAHMARTRLLESRVEPLEKFTNMTKITGYIFGGIGGGIWFFLQVYEKIVSLFSK